ncbi:hypothetical protein RFI_24665 [Reticulomyxa filosa]|uniref:TFIIS central domain-containing protein n=1 Tax=Reticulomyxa filosa TaxID=46433 RepID=X6MFM4_RETFI|nr:hypothetical protein RFI_24665 [Reticulomyxa filosa]|eukprot:ETO12709.1 hypothetical protein RFI_24665 [Reticulomyxa filosa]
MERLNEFPSLAKLVQMGELDITKILYVSENEIVDAARKTHADAKLLQQLSSLVGEVLAQDIIKLAKQYSKKDKTKYRDKMRDLMFNLHKNTKLINRLQSGNMTAEQLVFATNEELASEEISEYRNKVRKEIAQAQIIHEKLTDLKREGLIKKQVEVKPDDIPLSESIVKEMATTIGSAINAASNNGSAVSNQNGNDSALQIQQVTQPQRLITKLESDSSEGDDQSLLKNVTKSKLNDNTGNEDKEITSEKEVINGISSPKEKNTIDTATDKVIVKLDEKEDLPNKVNELVFESRQSDSESEVEEIVSNQTPTKIEVNLGAEEDDGNVTFVGLFNDPNPHSQQDSSTKKSSDSTGTTKKVVEDAKRLLTVSPSQDATSPEGSEQDTESEENKKKEKKGKSTFLSAGKTHLSSKKKRFQKTKEKHSNDDEGDNKKSKLRKKNQPGQNGKTADKHSYLWKGSLEYRDGDGKDAVFKCKLFQIGGDPVQRLPASSKISMTGRIAPKELEAHVIKTCCRNHLKKKTQQSLNHARRKVICVGLSVATEHEKVASECERYLRNAERCARFKSGDKDDNTSFDLYVMSYGVPHLNADFVKQRFKCSLPRHTVEFTLVYVCVWCRSLNCNIMLLYLIVFTAMGFKYLICYQKGMKTVKCCYTYNLLLLLLFKKDRDIDSLYSPEIETVRSAIMDLPKQKNDSQITEGLMREENSEIWSALNLLSTAIQNDQPTFTQVQPQNQSYHYPPPWQMANPHQPQHPFPNTYPPNNVKSLAFPQMQKTKMKCILCFMNWVKSIERKPVCLWERELYIFILETIFIANLYIHYFSETKPKIFAAKQFSCLVHSFLEHATFSEKIYCNF